MVLPSLGLACLSFSLPLLRRVLADLPEALLASLNIIPGDLVRTTVAGVSVDAGGAVSLEDPLCGFDSDPAQAAAGMSVVRSGGARLFADLLSKVTFQATIRQGTQLTLQSILGSAAI